MPYDLYTPFGVRPGQVSDEDRINASTASDNAARLAAQAEIAARLGIAHESNLTQRYGIDKNLEGTGTYGQRATQDTLMADKKAALDRELDTSATNRALGIVDRQMLPANMQQSREDAEFNLKYPMEKRRADYGAKLFDERFANRGGAASSGNQAGGEQTNNLIGAGFNVTDPQGYGVSHFDEGSPAKPAPTITYEGSERNPMALVGNGNGAMGAKSALSDAIDGKKPKSNDLSDWELGLVLGPEAGPVLNSRVEDKRYGRELDMNNRAQMMTISQKMMDSPDPDQRNLGVRIMAQNLGNKLTPEDMAVISKPPPTFAGSAVEKNPQLSFAVDQAVKKIVVATSGNGATGDQAAAAAKQLFEQTIATLVAAKIPEDQARTMVLQRLDQMLPARASKMKLFLQQPFGKLNETPYLNTSDAQRGTAVRDAIGLQ